VQEATHAGRSIRNAGTYENWVRAELNRAMASIILYLVGDGIALAEIVLAKAKWFPSEEILPMYV
jgi:hypothetical protein